VTAPRSIRARPVVEAIPGVAARSIPQLRTVADPRALRGRRLARACTAMAGLVACFGLFGVVGVHVMLAQGQGDVQRLQSQVDDKEAAQQRLRVQVAELESPDRIVAAARDLGMTTPSTVVVLQHASLADPPATTIPAPRATTTTLAQATPSTTAATGATKSTTAATGATGRA
jgi:cell division protein FtsL